MNTTNKRLNLPFLFAFMLALSFASDNGAMGKNGNGTLDGSPTSTTGEDNKTNFDSDDHDAWPLNISKQELKQSVITEFENYANKATTLMQRCQNLETKKPTVFQALNTKMNVGLASLTFALPGIIFFYPSQLESYVDWGMQMVSSHPIVASVGVMLGSAALLAANASSEYRDIQKKIDNEHAQALAKLRKQIKTKDMFMLLRKGNFNETDLSVDAQSLLFSYQSEPELFLRRSMSDNTSDNY